MFQMTKENPLEEECDILVPAAKKKQITRSIYLNNI